jgi:hypothetical protein
MWRKGDVVRLVLKDTPAPWVPVCQIEGKRKLDPRPTVPQFLRWAKDAALIGGRWE